MSVAVLYGRLMSVGVLCGRSNVCRCLVRKSNVRIWSLAVNIPMTRETPEASNEAK